MNSADRRKMISAADIFESDAIEQAEIQRVEKLHSGSGINSIQSTPAKASR